ncbi:MAG: heavy metal sensor histidine kinase [Gemmatimonadaceae bacterium]
MKLLPVGSWSLSARVTIWYSATVLLLLGASALVQYRTLASDLATEDDQQLRETVAAANRGTIGVGESTTSTSLIGPRIRGIDGRCNVVLGQPRVGGPPPLCGPTVGNEVRFRSWTSPEGRLWRTAIQRISPPAVAHTSDNRVVWIEATLDRWTDADLLAGYRRKLLILLPVALFVSALVGMWIVRRALSSLRRLSNVVSTVDAEALERGFILDGSLNETPSEVSELMSSLDGMRARLNEQFALLTKVSSDLAHELRTPIHVLRQQAEVALRKTRTADEYREVLASSLEEYESLQQMVDDILFLAKAENPFSRISRTTLSVSAEISDVAGFLEALALDSGVALHVDVPSDGVVLADRTLLRRALVNVLSNAIRHTPRGGWVTISTLRQNGSVILSIADTGPGIDRESVPHVFERYYRAPNAPLNTDGSGLGLAIVRGIMTLHGGTALLDSELGKGTIVSLAFPMQPESYRELQDTSILTKV